MKGTRAAWDPCRGLRMAAGAARGRGVGRPDTLGSRAETKSTKMSGVKRGADTGRSGRPEKDHSAVDCHNGKD